MPRPAGLAELAMETQVGIRDLKRVTVPLWESAASTGDWTVMSRCHELAATLRSAQRQCKAIAGLADRIACPDGRVGTNHGRAA